MKVTPDPPEALKPTVLNFPAPASSPHSNKWTHVSQGSLHKDLSPREGVGPLLPQWRTSRFSLSARNWGPPTWGLNHRATLG